MKRVKQIISRKYLFWMGMVLLVIASKSSIAEGLYWIAIGVLGMNYCYHLYLLIEGLLFGKNDGQYEGNISLLAVIVCSVLLLILGHFAATLVMLILLGLLVFAVHALGWLQDRWYR